METETAQTNFGMVRPLLVGGFTLHEYGTMDLHSNQRNRIMLLTSKSNPFPTIGTLLSNRRSCRGGLNPCQLRISSSKVPHIGIAAMY